MDVDTGLFFDNFQFISFKEQCEDRRKITRKRFLLNLESNEYYPPEGHVCFSFKSKSKSDDIEMTDDDYSETSKQFFYIGGGYSSEEASWNFASCLNFYRFSQSVNDLWIDDGGSVKLSGASFPPLRGSACGELRVSDDPCNTVILFWGGCNLGQQYGPTNELITLTCKRQRQKEIFDVTVLPEKNSLYEDDLFKNLNFQHGDIPCPRFGHSLTKISETEFLMFGGLTMPYRQGYDVSKTFYQCHPEFYLYVLSARMKEMMLHSEWKGAFHDESLCKRAFHTATLCKDDIVVIGGAVYENSKLKKRVSLREIIFLNISSVEPSSVKSKPVINLDKDTFISSHAAAICPADPNLLCVFGGYQQNEELVSCKVPPSAKLFIIDLNNSMLLKTLNETGFETAGHTMTFIDSDTMLINGGTNKSLALFSSKPMTPDPCDLGGDCKIDDSFMAPIPWIQCEGLCGRWLHQFCIGLRMAPRGKYICEDCKSNPQNRRRSNQN